jgi:FdrA protein
MQKTTSTVCVDSVIRREKRRKSLEASTSTNSPIGLSRSERRSRELLEPDRDGTISQYLEEHGPGLHHIGVSVADLDAAVERLTAAGATTFYDTAEAIEYVARCLSRPLEAAYPPVSLASFQSPLAAVNVGLESFYDSLKSQGAEAIQVDWRPPAGGNEKLMALLAKMK